MNPDLCNEVSIALLINVLSFSVRKTLLLNLMRLIGHLLFSVTNLLFPKYQRLALDISLLLCDFLHWTVTILIIVLPQAQNSSAVR